MARLVFPDEGSRFTYRPVGTQIFLVPAAVATVYTTAAGTTLADIAVHDGTTTPGAVIAGSRLTVDANSMLPLFWGPDGVDTVWVSVSGGPVTPAYARTDDRLDTLVTGLATKVAKGELVLNVKDYGAIGNGVADDTAAIDAAWAAVPSSGYGGTLFFPRGTYIYNGDGLVGGSYSVRGDSRSSTQINLGAGKYLLRPTGIIGTLNVSDIKFSGGAGMFNSQFTGTNVSGHYVVERCVFSDYTACAIGHNSSDMPYWKIRGNIFQSANYTSTIAIALPGLTDQVTIEDNSFLANRVSVKLGNGGNNAHIRSNDFIRFGAAAGFPRVDLWVVPKASAANAGPGLVCSENKFGNENLDVTDYKVLFADATAGADFTTTFPVVGAASTGFIIGHSYRDNLFNFTSTATIPPFFSTTPNVRSGRFSAFIAGHEVVEGVFGYLPAVVALMDQETLGNVYGPLVSADQNSLPLPVGNAPSSGQLDDPALVMENQGLTTAHRSGGGGDNVGYVDLCPATINTFTLLGGSTRVAATDSHGGTDAATVTLPSGSLAYGYVSPGTVVAGAVVWVEFDVKAAATTPLSHLLVLFGLDGAGPSVLRRNLVPRSGWTRYRFQCAPRSSANNTLVTFAPRSGATGTDVVIGRVRVYHAREPLPTDLEIVKAPTTVTAPAAGGAGALPATPAGYVTAYINGTSRKIAYY